MRPIRAWVTYFLWAVELIQLLSSTSILMNALSWHVSIIGKELTLQNERSYIAHQLQSSEKQFKLKTFSVIKDCLMKLWTMRDRLLVEERQNGDSFPLMKTTFIIALVKPMRASASALDKGYTILKGFDARMNH